MPDFGAKVVRDLLAYRSKGTHVDEILWLLLGLLLFSSIVSLTIGFLLHQQTFAAYFSPTFSWVFAVLFVLLIEVAKIAVQIKMWWMLLFGLWNEKGWSSVGVTLIALILSAAATVWSWRNSTEGAHILFTQIAAYKNPAPPFDPSAYTTAIDAQISQAESARREATATKWRGTTTVDGQRAAKNQSKIIAELTAQRGEILKQARSDYDKRQAVIADHSQATSFVAASFGGWAEGFQIILCFGITLCFKLLYEYRSQQPTTTQHPAPAAAPPTLHTVTNGQNPYLNGTERRPIGFFQSPTNAVEHRQTVSDSPPGAQPNLFIAEPQKWRNRATQCHRRSLDTQASSTARRDNAKRRDLFLKALGIVGWKGEPTDDGEIIFERVPVQPAMTDEKRLKNIMLQIQQISTPEPENA